MVSPASSPLVGRSSRQLHLVGANDPLLFSHRYADPAALDSYLLPPDAGLEKGPLEPMDFHKQLCHSNPAASVSHSLRQTTRGRNCLGFSFHKYKMSVQVDNVVLFSINKHVLACEPRRECLERAARSRKDCGS